MRALTIVDGTLTFASLPDPVPGPGQLLVRVEAAGLNRADLFARAGTFHGAATTGPQVAGGECSGEVIALGPGAMRFVVGDRVMAMAGAAFSELCVVDDAVAVAIPDALSWTAAAALPVACCTEHDALRTTGRLQPGESVLVSGATSAVGIAAVQIARRLGAGTVFVTSRRRDRAEALRAFGADVAIDTSTDDLAALVKKKTDGRGVDVVIDHVGGALLGPSLHAMALGGRLVSVGRLGGLTAQIDLDLVARKRLSIIGVTFRTRSRRQFADIAQAMSAELIGCLADGSVGPPVVLVVPFESVDDAYEAMSSDAVLGKIVLAIGPNAGR